MKDRRKAENKTVNSKHLFQNKKNVCKLNSVILSLEIANEMH